MSVLVAIKDRDRVAVGVDTRMSCGESFVDSYKQRPKAYHIDEKKHVIVGGVGNIGLVDVFRVLMENHLAKADSIDRHYIVRYIIPELINDVKVYCMEDKNCKMDGDLFLAIKDRGFLITGNYLVEELTDYMATGSGMDAAKGSLHTTSHFVMSPEERIRLAIKAAGSVISSVSSTAMYGDTKGKIFTVLENSKR